MQIVSSRREGEALVIEYVEQQPAREAILTQVLTFPFHIVRLPRYDGTVRFQRASNPAR